MARIESKMSNIPKAKWPQIRISPEIHAKLLETSAIESGKQKKRISLIDWTCKIIKSGLKIKNYIDNFHPILTLGSLDSSHNPARRYIYHIL